MMYALEEEERPTYFQRISKENGLLGLSVLHRLYPLYGFVVLRNSSLMLCTCYLSMWSRITLSNGFLKTILPKKTLTPTWQKYHGPQVHVNEGSLKVFGKPVTHHSITIEHDNQRGRALVFDQVSFFFMSLVLRFSLAFDQISFRSRLVFSIVSSLQWGGGVVEMLIFMLLKVNINNYLRALQGSESMGKSVHQISIHVTSSWTIFLTNQTA